MTRRRSMNKARSIASFPSVVAVPCTTPGHASPPTTPARWLIKTGRTSMIRVRSSQNSEREGEPGMRVHLCWVSWVVAAIHPQVRCSWEKIMDLNWKIWSSFEKETDFFFFPCIPLGKLPKLSTSVCPSSTQALPTSQGWGVCNRFFSFLDEKVLISITYFLEEEENRWDSCFQAHVYLNVLPAYINYNHHDDFLKIKKKEEGGQALPTVPELKKWCHFFGFVIIFISLSSLSPRNY